MRLPRRLRPLLRAPRAPSRADASRRPPRAQCYDKPSPGRILSPKDNLNLLQGATIEVRRSPRRRAACAVPLPHVALRRAGAGTRHFPPALWGSRDPLFVCCHHVADAPAAAVGCSRSCTGRTTGCGTAPRSCPSTRVAAAPRHAAPRAPAGRHERQQASHVLLSTGLWQRRILTRVTPAARARAGAVQHWRRGAAVAGRGHQRRAPERRARVRATRPHARARTPAARVHAHTQHAL
jgi:hypothetical protein